MLFLSATSLSIVLRLTFQFIVLTFQFFVFTFQFFIYTFQFCDFIPVTARAPVNFLSVVLLGTLQTKLFITRAALKEIEAFLTCMLFAIEALIICEAPFTHLCATIETGCTIVIGTAFNASVVLQTAIVLAYLGAILTKLLFTRAALLGIEAFLTNFFAATRAGVIKEACGTNKTLTTIAFLHFDAIIAKLHFTRVTSLQRLTTVVAYNASTVIA